MIYILNTNLENKKKVKIALHSIYGVGKKLSTLICDELGITSSVRINQLTNKQIELLTAYISQHHRIGADLKQQKRQNKNRLVQIASYKGFRHSEGLPLRGQRTHSNAKTARKIKMKIDSF